MPSEIGVQHWIGNFGATFVFTVNVAVAEVAITIVGTPALVETAALIYFDANDNCFIEQIQLVLPYQFTGADMPPPSVSLEWFDKIPANGPILEFGNAGRLNIPEWNQPIDVQNFIPYPAGAIGDWGIRISAVTGCWANMFNTPAALDTTIQQARVMLRVRHTLQMVA